MNKFIFQILAKHFKHPKGILGKYVGKEMDKKIKQFGKQNGIYILGYK